MAVRGSAKDRSDRQEEASRVTRQNEVSNAARTRRKRAGRGEPTTEPDNEHGDVGPKSNGAQATRRKKRRVNSPSGGSAEADQAVRTRKAVDKSGRGGGRRNSGRTAADDLEKLETLANDRNLNETQRKIVQSAVQATRRKRTDCGSGRRGGRRVSSRSNDDAGILSGDDNDGHDSQEEEDDDEVLDVYDEQDTDDDTEQRHVPRQKRLDDDREESGSDGGGSDNDEDGVNGSGTEGGQRPICGVSDDEQEVSFTLGGGDKPVEGAPAGSGEQGAGGQDRGNTLGRSTTALISNNGKTMESSTNKFDESIILNVMSVVKKDIVTVVENTVSKAVEDAVKGQDMIRLLNERVTDHTSIVSTIASQSLVKQQSCSSRTKEIHKQICLLTHLFNDEFILHIISKCSVCYCLTRISSVYNFRVQQDMGIELLNILYFSKQPYETKREKFQSPIGEQFSKFRSGVLKSCFLAMQKNSFNTFPEVEEVINLSNSNDSSEQLAGRNEEEPLENQLRKHCKRPFWLKPGYVTADHCLAATRKTEIRMSSVDNTKDTSSQSYDNESCEGAESNDVAESSQSSKVSKVNRNGPINRDEIAIEAAEQLCRRITDVLHKSRETSKRQIFTDLLYLFTGWAQFTNVKVNQKNMGLRWAKEGVECLKYMDSLPVMKCIRLEERFLELGPTHEQVHIDNLKALHKVIKDHPELTLIADHDVVIDDGTKSKRNATVRRLSFHISLIEVAAKFLSSYTSLDCNSKVKYILGVDGQVVRLAVVFALGLRNLLEGAVADLNRTNSVLWADNVNPSSKRGKKPKVIRTTSPTSQAYKFANFDGLSVTSLMPSHTRQKETLVPLLLTLTQSEFDTKHDGPRQEHHGASTEVGNDDDGMMSTPDPNLGVSNFL